MTALDAGDISRRLARRVDALVIDLLPGGHREAQEWRCGSIAGEPGHSLGVHIGGAKAGVWADFATGQRGDALNLVRAVLGLDMADALAWARRWLGLADGAPELPQPPIKGDDPVRVPDPARWRRPWNNARPIAGTLAETYLSRRGLAFSDRVGRVLRYAPHRARRHPESDGLEHHPALLAALHDIRTGEQCGIVNVYLRSDGADRLRDRKGKTTTGRARGAAIMLSPFDEPTYGLTVGEGAETGIALLMTGLAPVWALGGSGNLRSFPVLAGIEALTLAADADRPGQQAAGAVATRWRRAGREVVIIAPSAGDWADPRRSAA
jgi:putative DNA primase/helicase